MPHLPSQLISTTMPLAFVYEVVELTDTPADAVMTSKNEPSMPTLAVTPKE